MKRRSFIILLSALALMLPLLGAVPAQGVELTELTEWISDDGGSAGRELPAISADGRYVAFVGRSEAYNGVWIKDRAKPNVPAKRVATGFLFNPDISADGTFVAWVLYGGGSGGQSIYVLEWQKDGAVPELVSLGDDQLPADAVVDFPSLSKNGRFVAFQSMDRTLDADAAPGPMGGGPNKVYVRDRLTDETEMISLAGVNNPEGDAIVNGNAIKPDINPSGRYIAFASDAGILQGASGEEAAIAPAVEEEETTFQQVYLRDRVAKTTTPVSLATEGTTFGDGGSSTSYGPTLSDDGSKVAFESDASNLVAGDTNKDTDAFVRNMLTGTTVRVSLDETGAQVDMTNPEPEPEPTATMAPPEEGETEDVTPNIGAGPAISGNGAFVAFESDAPLTSDDLNEVEDTCTDESGTVTAIVPMTDVYRYGLVDEGLTRWSKANDAGVEIEPFEATGFRVDGMTGECVPANNGVDPTIARDGSRIAFVSNGNLIGRIVEEEDHETLAEEEPVTAIEPGLYLHRPNPEPDIIAPVSKAFSRDVDRYSPIKVRYTKGDYGFPRTRVVAVQLYAKIPGWARFRWIQTDVGAMINNVFKVKVLKDGKYKFYTRARDAAGNLEKAPAKADTITVFK